MSAPRKTRTKTELDIDKLTDVVVGMMQQLEQRGALSMPLTATFTNKDGTKAARKPVSPVLTGDRCH